LASVGFGIHLSYLGKSAIRRLMIISELADDFEGCRAIADIATNPWRII
jgi:hypothetical protein